MFISVKKTIAQIKIIVFLYLLCISESSVMVNPSLRGGGFKAHDLDSSRLANFMTCHLLGKTYERLDLTMT